VLRQGFLFAQLSHFVAEWVGVYKGKGGNLIVTEKSNMPRISKWSNLVVLD
jgi:hypothetical protein